MSKPVACEIYWAIMGLFFNKTLLEDLYRYEGDGNQKLKVKLRYLFCAPGYTYIFFLSMQKIKAWYATP